MKALIAAVAATIAVVVGSSLGGAFQPPTAPTAAIIAPAVTAAPAADVKDLQEDEPGWNCLVNGNKICGPVGDSATAAWAAYDKRPISNPDAFRVDYRGTAMAGIDFPPSEFYTVPAAAGMVHVFQTEVTK